MRFAFPREWVNKTWSKTVATVAPPVEPAPAPRSDPSSELGDIDLRAIWQELVRKRAWVVIPTGLALLLSLVAVNMITPRYKSERASSSTAARTSSCVPMANATKNGAPSTLKP